MTFTKEQLIERCEEAIASLKPCAGLAETKSLACFEIALAALTAGPVLYCMEGDALDEENVSTSKAVVDSWVEEWNGEGRCPGEPVYKTVSLYRLPEIE